MKLKSKIGEITNIIFDSDESKRELFFHLEEFLREENKLDKFKPLKKILNTLYKIKIDEGFEFNYNTDSGLINIEFKL